MKTNLFLRWIVLFSIQNVFAQPVIQAVKIDNPPQIDGDVIEEVWDKAFLVNDFYQREPNLDAPGSQKTEFMVCYDEHNIYFAVKCWDTPEMKL